MVGRAGGERSSSVVEILTLHFFTYCLQHYVGLGHKIRTADSEPFKWSSPRRRDGVPQAESE